MTTPGAGAFREYVAAVRARVDVALDRALPGPPACPERLGEAMRYSLFAGGKRLRPILTLAAADATTRRRRLDAQGREQAVAAAVPAACAVEMIHTYSLIHDDLPAMDNDTLRRGRPTLHVVYGEGLATLAGDALLTEAFALLAREPQGEAADLAERKLRVIGLIAHAAGVAGMAGGQALDLEGAGPVSATASAGPLDPNALRRMHECKTGALIRASAVSGAIMAGGDAALTSTIDTYAAEIGLAFQIVDDVLDVEGLTEELGKTAGKDRAAGKRTYPALFGLAESKRLAEESAARAAALVRHAGLDDGHLEAIAEWIVRRTN